LTGTFTLLSIIIVVVIIICSPSRRPGSLLSSCAGMVAFLSGLQGLAILPEADMYAYCTSMMGCINIDMCYPPRKIRPHWQPVIITPKCNVAVVDYCGYPLRPTVYPTFLEVRLWGELVRSEGGNLSLAERSDLTLINYCACTLFCQSSSLLPGSFLEIMGYFFLWWLLFGGFLLTRASGLSHFAVRLL
jgi:hypothetical protein